MAKITIKNVGPIKEAELELNKINVFMGPQSSGKSTIAKLISYCTWVEKRSFMDGQFKGDIYNNLLKFHHLDKNYFDDNSYIEYKSDFIKINYQGKNLIQTIEIDETKELEYKNSQNVYIPSERNFVSVIPNLGKYNETNDNIMNFIYDWSSIKKMKEKEISSNLNNPTYSIYGAFDKQHSLPILDLGVNYYYQAETDTDMLILQNKNSEIPLQVASSGLQSIIPLYVITISIFSKRIDKTFSITEKEQYNALLKKYRIEDSKDSLTLRYYRDYTHANNLIIEEPEQNLFPETQRDLLYFLLDICSESPEHNLTITTHSPYILYALNNCMLGKLVYDKMNDDDKKNVNCLPSLISPEKVSIYEIKDGLLCRIQQEDGLIGTNYFDQNMKALMDDFYVFLKYYDDEE